MTWSMLDDGFHDHPKVMECSYEARGVWVTALSWSARRLTEGVLPRKLATVLEFPPDAVAELVKVGLWDVTPSGWEIHDYLDYNDSKAEAHTKRAKNTAKLKRWRANKRTCNQVTDPVTDPLPDPDPDPVPETEKTRSTPAGAREEQSVCQIGHDLLWNATGLPYVMADWADQLYRIGIKPPAERAAVLATLLADPWVAANKFACDPKHVLKHWARYAAGNPQLRPVAAAGGRYAGPSRVPTAAEYAADKDWKAPWES